MGGPDWTGVGASKREIDVSTPASRAPGLPGPVVNDPQQTLAARP